MNTGPRAMRITRNCTSFAGAGELLRAFQRVCSLPREGTCTIVLYPSSLRCSRNEARKSSRLELDFGSLELGFFLSQKKRKLSFEQDFIYFQTLLFFKLVGSF